MLTERDAVPHGVVLNYDYVDLPSYIGTSGPENRLRFPGRRGVFLSPLGIILPPHWVGVLGPSISSEAGIAMGRVCSLLKTAFPGPAGRIFEPFGHHFAASLGRGFRAEYQ